MKRRKKLNNAITEQQKMLKPTAYRIYLRLGRHLDRTSQYPCDHCYVKGNSLIIQGDVTAHVKSIVGNDFEHIALDNVIEDLQGFNLVSCAEIREGLHELALLYERKEVSNGR